tara:strand:- start:178 stop:366 length:189 start_codon:yes stop_codon:yes gene_type:complete
MSEQQTVETPEQAIGLLIQAVQLAQSRGSYNLNEASLLSQAVGLLVPAEIEEDDDAEPEESE